MPNGKAPQSFQRTRVVERLPTYAPRVLRLDETGRLAAARTINKRNPRQPLEPDPNRFANRAADGIARLSRERSK